MYAQILQKVCNGLSRDYEGWSKRNDYLTPSQHRKLKRNLASLYTKALKAYSFAAKHRL